MCAVAPRCTFRMRLFHAVRCPLVAWAWISVACLFVFVTCAGATGSASHRSFALSKRGWRRIQRGACSASAKSIRCRLGAGSQGRSATRATGHCPACIRIRISSVLHSNWSVIPLIVCKERPSSKPSTETGSRERTGASDSPEQGGLASSHRPSVLCSFRTSSCNSIRRGARSTTP